MTSAQKYGYLFTSDATSTSFTAQGFTATAPSGTGVMTRGTGPFPSTRQLIHVIPYGKGANDDTFGMRFYGYQQDLTDSMWVPQLLCHVVCTMTSARTGASGKTITENHYFCDGFSITFPTTTVGEPDSIKIIKPGSDIIGGFYFDTMGFVRIKCDIDLLGTSTHANALYRGF